MERTVNQGYFQWIQRITCQHTILHGSSEALLNWRNEFLRNVTTLHFINELQTTLSKVFINRADVHNNISELTTTTRLFLINLTQVNCLSDSLFVVNLRFTLVTFYFEFTFQTVDNDIQVKLTHTGNNCLTCLFVSFHCECRVFFSQFSQTVRQFVHILLSFRFHSNTDYRFREVHWLKNDRSCFVTQCITSVNILETYTGTNITGTNHFYRILFVWVHLEQTRNTFFLTWTRVVDIRTGFNLTRVYTEESQTSYIRVSSDLKCQSWSFIVFARFTIFFGTGIRVCTNYVFSIQRRRQESTNIVKQSLYALILEWRTAQHRNYSHLNSCIAKSSQYFFFCNSRRIIKVFFHQRIIKFSYFFKHFISPFVGFVNEISRNFFYGIVSTHCFIVPVDSFHFDQINQSFEVFFCTDRNNNRTRICTQNSLHLANNFKEVSTRTVHFVNVSDTRYVIFVSLTP